MIPVGRLLILGIGVSMDFFAMDCGIEAQMERVLGHPSLEARTCPWGTLKERRLVIARPGVTACARSAEVSGQHERKICRPVHFRGMEPMVDSFTLMNRNRFDGGDVFGKLLDEFPWRPGDLADCLDIVVFQVYLVESPQSGAIYTFSIGQLQFEGTLQRR